MKHLLRRTLVLEEAASPTPPKEGLKTRASKSLSFGEGFRVRLFLQLKCATQGTVSSIPAVGFMVLISG